MEPAFLPFDPDSVRRRAAGRLPRALDDWLVWLESGGGGVATTTFCALEGDWLDDFWIDYGSDLSESFSFFLRMFEGSRIGIWHRAGIATDVAPVVLVGGEGDAEVLGDTTTQFLSRLASDPELNLIDLPPGAEFEPFRSDLERWIHARAARLAPGPGRGVDDTVRSTGADFRAWLDHESASSADRAQTDPKVIAIQTVLDGFIPPGRLADLKPWESLRFDINCVGDHVRVTERNYGPQPVPPEVEHQLRPLAVGYRRSRAASVPGRGAWFTAAFRRGALGWATPACSFEDPPEFEVSERPVSRQALQTYNGGFIGPEDYRKDLRDYPRSDRWMPDWLVEVVHSSCDD